MEKTAEQRLQSQLEALVSEETVGFTSFVEKTAETLSSDALEDTAGVEVERQESGETLTQAEMEKEAAFDPFDYPELLIKSAAAHIIRMADEEGMELPFGMFPGAGLGKEAGSEALEGLGTTSAKNLAKTIERRKQSLQGRSKYNPISQVQTWRAGRRGEKKMQRAIAGTKMVGAAAREAGY